MTSVTVALAATAPAAAQNLGPYVGLGGGIVLPYDSDIQGTSINASIKLKAAGLTSLHVGHAFENGLRSEIEVGTRRASIDDVSRSATGSGEVKVWNFIGNLLYDFQVEDDITPYLGVGVGYAALDFDDIQPIGGSTITDQGGSLAYQGIVGIGFSLNSQFSLFADYRYLGVGDVDLRTNGSVDVNAGYDEHRLTFGLRFSFGGPKENLRGQPQPVALPSPPPKPLPPSVAQIVPPPSPSTPPATQDVGLPRAYFVFFEWDKADLTTEAKEIVKVAANNSRNNNVTRVQTTGHADRSGSNSYNLRLSILRAERVRAELINNGVPANIIMVVGKGETRPLIPTANGIREPHNRRVEIVLE